MTTIEAYSPETEATVLACMMNSEEQFAIAKSSLTSDDFFSIGNKKIFRALIEAHERNGGVDLPSLITYLRDTQDLSQDEYSHLLELSEMSDRYQNIELHCDTLRDFSTRREIAEAYKDSVHDLDKGILASKVLDRLLEKANAIKERQSHGASAYGHLLVRTSEKEIAEEIKNISPGARVGMKIGAVDLKIPGGALSIVAGPTGHGKTLVLINMILNYLSLHQDKSAYFFSFEESRASILSLFLNTYINEELSQNNRESIKSYFRDDDVKYINTAKRDIFIQIKNKFFKTLIESGRLNIFYRDYSSEELCGALSFLKKNTDIGIVGIDYMQFLKLQKKQNIQRQEEMKQICLMLKDCAVDTGLPILVAAQFNRSVVNEATISPVAIGEAGDIERAANMIIGLWNRNYENFTDEGNKGRNGQKITKEPSIYLEIIKGRETGIGHAAVFNLNGNTGKLSPKTKTSDSSTPPSTTNDQSFPLDKFKKVEK